MMVYVWVHKVCICVYVHSSTYICVTLCKCIHILYVYVYVYVLRCMQHLCVFAWVLGCVCAMKAYGKVACLCGA